MNAVRNLNTSTASAPVDDLRQDAFDELVGSEEFGNKFVADFTQEFYELTDYKDGPLGDAAIVRAVRRLTELRNARANEQLDAGDDERMRDPAEIAAEREDLRDNLEGR